MSYQDVAMLPKRETNRSTVGVILRERCSDDGVVGQMPEMGKFLSVCTIVVGREKGVERVVVIVSSPLSSGFEMSACHPDTVYSTRAAESLERHAGDVMVGA